MQRLQEVVNSFVSNFSIAKVFLALCFQLTSWILLKINDIFNPLVWVLLSFYIIDALTRCMVEQKRNNVSSKEFREKFSKKAKDQWYLILPFIFLSLYNASFSTMVIFLYWYFIVGELKSICENIQENGGAIPSIVSKGLNVSKDALEHGKIPDIGEIIQSTKEGKENENQRN